MAQIPEITVGDLLKHQRIDAEYFRPFFIKTDKFIGSLENQDFVTYTKFVKKGIFDISPDHYVEENGIPFIRSGDLKDPFITSSDIIEIDNEAHEKELKTELNIGDLLMAKVGRIGDVAVNYRFEKLNLSQNVIGVKIKEQFKRQSGFLMVFLNSKYGRSQIDRKLSGQVQQKITLDDFKYLKVPSLSKDFIEKTNQLAEKSYSLQLESKSLYAQAEQILLQELGLEDFTPEWITGYETDFVNILKVARMDAEYFQPRYELLMEKIGNANKIEKLGDISTLSKKKVNILPEETYKYIEIGDVDTSNGEFTYNEIAGVDLPANAKKNIQDESLLISTVRPTRGAVGVIPNGWNNGFVVSGAFAVFEKHSISPFYLQVVMRSIIGKMQLERCCTGVSYPTVTDEDAANVIIPLLDDKKIEKIHDLVMESHKSLHESRQLLEQAKREVEEMIESKSTDKEKSKLVAFN